MRGALQIDVVPGLDDPRCQAGLSLYAACFPAWELEPLASVRRKLATGRYQLTTGSLAGEVVAFGLVDLVPSLDYAFLAYMGVHERLRGAGLGSVLCRGLIEDFRGGIGCGWFFVEAEAAQARFYGRLGFRMLDLDYRVPCFDGAGVEPMALMVLPAETDATRVPATVVRDVIRDGFTSGHSLPADDPRIADQLARVTGPVPLRSWPPPKPPG